MYINKLSTKDTKRREEVENNHLLLILDHNQNINKGNDRASKKIRLVDDQKTNKHVKGA